MTTPLTHPFPAARQSDPSFAPVGGAAAKCHALHMGKAISGHRRDATAHGLLCWPDKQVVKVTGSLRADTRAEYLIKRYFIVFFCRQK